MTDAELLAFTCFVLERFSGFVPEEKMLVNALADFRRSELSKQPEAAKSLPFAWRPPVIVHFEDIHYQTFMEGMKTEGTFFGNRMATAGDDVKQLEYTIEHNFTPERRYRGRKPNDLAMMTVHLRARVTDLQSSDSYANTRQDKAQSIKARSKR